MAEPGDDRLKDVATLTRAIENVFRKLIRFLVGRISLIRLQEMIRTIFVEEAELLLRGGTPDREMSLAELSLLSGLDTRAITKIRKSDGYHVPFSKQDSFLIDLNPGSSIIDIWSREEPYFDSKTCVPRALDVSGSSLSFEALFNDHITARGVTAMSLLSRLIDSGSVALDEKQAKVRLLKYSYFPITPMDEVGAIEMGFSAVNDLLDTLFHNLTKANTADDKRFQRGSWSLRLPKSEIKGAKTELCALLKRTDDEAREIIRRFEISDSESEYIKAGVAYFYFEEPSPLRKPPMESAQSNN